ncbi:DUF4158 domain-containing protein, partial [Escherichia sp. R-CC3]
SNSRYSRKVKDRKLANWLLPTAMGTEKGLVLVDLLIQEMRKRKIILPAMYAIEHLVWAVCERAERRTRGADCRDE